MDNPCVRDCPRRSATCHSSCTEYEKFDQYNQMRREERYLKTILLDYSPSQEARFKKNTMERLRKRAR
jgi:hypothetical protein